MIDCLHLIITILNDMIFKTHLTNGIQANKKLTESLCCQMADGRMWQPGTPPSGWPTPGSCGWIQSGGGRPWRCSSVRGTAQRMKRSKVSSAHKSSDWLTDWLIDWLLTKWLIKFVGLLIDWLLISLIADWLMDRQKND